MILREQVMAQSGGAQLEAEAIERLDGLLSDDVVVLELMRIRGGDPAANADHSVAHALTATEFGVLTSGRYRQRFQALAADGVNAQVYDVEMTATGRRSRVLQLSLMPPPTAPRNR